MTVIEERALKVNRILEEYDKRKIQLEVAEMFKMSIKHVSRVTQRCNYIHTRKVTPENIKPKDSISPIIDYEKFEFLDQYPIQNFE